MEEQKREEGRKVETEREKVKDKHMEADRGTEVGGRWKGEESYTRLFGKPKSKIVSLEKNSPVCHE